MPGADIDTEVLVVGAGPSGLATAAVLAGYGVPVRVVDRGPGPVEESRASIVHARSLETLDRLGLAARAVRTGLPITGVDLHERGRQVARLPLAGDGAEGRTRFPYALSLPQGDLEQLLLGHLAELGVPVDRDTALESVVDEGHRVRAGLCRDGRREVVLARWLVGADGAGSTVRRCLGLSFGGATYPQTGLLADAVLDVDLAPDRLRLNLVRGGFVGVLPLGGRRYRLFGAVPPGFTPHAGNGEAPSHDAYAGLPAADLRHWFTGYFHVAGQLEKVLWASLFRLHSRIADRFRVGRVFLVGDAAHIHSPAGGQGLNLGIGDADNLGWKLALVARARAGPVLLDSYQVERRAVARTVLRRTDRGFAMEVTRNPVAVWLRSHVLARLIGPLARRPAVRRAVFRMLSQTWVHYRQSPAVARSGSAAGDLRPGDRAPHAPLDRIAGADSVLDLIRAPGYHLLLFSGGRPDPGFDALRQAAQRAAGRYPALVAVHEIPAGEVRAHLAYGADRPRAVLVRPDGHIAATTTGSPPDADPIAAHLNQVTETG